MEQLILWAIASMGMTHIVVSGFIFKRLRERLDGTTKMLRCYQCSGFWSGIITWLLGGASVWATESHMVFSWLRLPFTLLLCGCFGSFIGMASAVVLDWFERKE